MVGSSPIRHCFAIVQSWAGAVLWLFVVIGSASVSAQTIPPDFWVQLGRSTTDACEAKQRADPATGSGFRPEVIRSACECYVSKFISRAKTSPEFIAAAKSNDRAAAEPLIISLSQEPNGQHTLTACTEQVVAKSGGLKGSINTQQSPQTVSSLPGLKGQSRASFVDEANRTCNTEVKGISPNKTDDVRRGFCRCYAEGMADKFSEQDLVEILRSGSFTRGMEEKRQQAGKVCFTRYLQ